MQGGFTNGAEHFDPLEQMAATLQPSPQDHDHSAIVPYQGQM